MTWVAATFFGLMLLGMPVGYVLGWLFARYGLVAAISGHISYNSCLLVLAFLASKLPDPAGL